jgi:hypothetical protein
MYRLNLQCLNVLHYLLALHKEGFTGLRFMPYINDNGWFAAIGPRILFSENDGSFILQDLSHRCISLQGNLEKLETAKPNIESLFPLYRISQASKRLDEEAIESLFLSWIENCQTKDAAYTEWLNRLAEKLVSDSTFIPTRPEKESASPKESKFSISAQRTTGDVEFRSDFEAPPPGKAASSGPVFGKAYVKSIFRTGDVIGGVAVKPNVSMWNESTIDKNYENNVFKDHD